MFAMLQTYTFKVRHPIAVIMVYFTADVQISHVLISTVVASLVLLPARASEQGNVIGLVSVYICVCTKKPT